MEKIVRKGGYVYLEIWHDFEGRHKTMRNLGKDPDDPMWKEEVEEISKPQKKKRKKSN